MQDKITEAARNHLAQGGRDGIPILEVYQAEALGTDAGQWQAFLERVKEQIRKTKELAATRVFLYTRVPIAMAAMLGATLTNGPRVVIHQHNGGTYDEVGLVSFETTKL